jgi:hypothetical protein
MLHETSNASRTKLPDHITSVEVKKKSAFGHHHTYVFFILISSMHYVASLLLLKDSIFNFAGKCPSCITKIKV